MPSSLEDALKHHQAGELRQAAQLYKEILTAHPQHADAYHLLGVLMHQLQQSQVAVELIGRAIQINGYFAPYHNNLGNALLALGRRDDARASFRHSITLDPNADTYINLATLDLGDGRTGEAKAGFKAALRLSPKRLEGLVGLGRIALTEGQTVMARRWLDKAMSVDPNCGVALNVFGDLHLAENTYDEAEKCYTRAIECLPSDVDAQLNLGNLHIRLERSALAAESYRKAFQLSPQNHSIAILLGTAYLMEENAEAAKQIAVRALQLDEQHPASHFLLGSAFVLCRDYEKALACFERALSLDPKQHEALNGMGNAYDLLGEYDRAALAFEAALALQPESATYLLNIGMIKGRQNDSRAISFLDRAIALDPDDAKAHIAIGETLLSFGDYNRGFAEYEWRWRFPPFSKQHRQYDAPLWDGSSLAGRTILLHAEQGLGDTIQFVRFLPQVAKLGGTIVLAIQQPLFRLFESLEGAGITLHREVDPLPAFDVQCPLLSLPAVLGTELQTIPAPIDLRGIFGGIVAADQPRKSNAPFNVGVVWAGNSIHKRDSLRSISLAALLPLRNVAHCKFVSLQKDVPQADRAILQELQMERPLDECHDLLDTAYAMKELDLVLSVDTGVAHLAATLGKTVWLILPEAADWRWGKAEDTTPWYPTMKLFRKQPGETAKRLVERLVRALQANVNSSTCEDRNSAIS